MVRDALPNTLSGLDETTIQIIKYHRDVPCIYTDVLSIHLQRTLWSGKRAVYFPDSEDDETVHVDLMLHVGMRPSKDHCCVEKFARREGYEQRGEDGKYLDGAITKERGYCEHVPEILKPVFDVEKAVARLEKDLPVSFFFPLLSLVSRKTSLSEMDDLTGVFTGEDCTRRSVQ